MLCTRHIAIALFDRPKHHFRFFDFFLLLLLRLCLCRFWFWFWFGFGFGLLFRLGFIPRFGLAVPLRFRVFLSVFCLFIRFLSFLLSFLLFFVYERREEYFLKKQEKKSNRIPSDLFFISRVSTTRTAAVFIGVGIRFRSRTGGTTALAQETVVRIAWSLKKTRKYCQTLKLTQLNWIENNPWKLYRKSVWLKIFFPLSSHQMINQNLSKSMKKMNSFKKRKRFLKKMTSQWPAYE